MRVEARARTERTSAPGGFLCASSVRKRLASIGTSVSETNAEARIASADDHRELVEQQADHARHEEDRDEHRDQRGRDRDDREADLARAAQRRLERRLAVLDVAHDVLEHHDRVVDDQADGQRQAEQRDVVEAVAEAPTAARPRRPARPAATASGSRSRRSGAGTGRSPARPARSCRISVSVTSCSASRIETERSLTGDHAAPTAAAAHWKRRQRGAHRVDHLARCWRRAGAGWPA